MDDTVDRARLEASPQPAAPVAPAPQPPNEWRPTPKRRRRLTRWLVIVVLAVAAIFVWEQFQKRETEPETAGRGGPPPQTVRDAEVTTGDVPIIINALGAVTPLASVTIRTQVNGQLQKIGFEEGQMVIAGDFLAQIDPRPFEATARSVQGAIGQGHCASRSGRGRFRALSDAQ